MILRVDADNRGCDRFPFTWIDQAISENDDFVAYLPQTRRRAVQGNLPRFSLDDISLKAHSIIEIDHLYPFVHSDGRGGEQISADPDRPLILEIRVGDAGAMNLGAEKLDEHVTDPVSELNKVNHVLANFFKVHQNFRSPRTTVRIAECSLK